MKVFRKIYWWIFICVLSLRWIPKINIGDTVIYQGEKWVARQGVCDPSWEFSRAGGKTRISINKCNVEKEKSLENYWHSFSSGYRFYMTNWYDIWIREGILPWMKGCNIWANKQ